MRPDDARLVAHQYADDERLRIRAETHRRHWRGGVSLPEWVLGHVAAGPGDVVADVGCGPGTLYHAALRAAGARVVGVDASAGMLRVAARGCLAVRGDAGALPLASGSCDRVMCNHVLYHVGDRLGALRELRRVARAGGRVVVTTTSRRSMPQLREVGGVSETLPFALEDGDVVARVFPSVEVHELGRRLVFPDADPVVRYVATSDPDPALLDDVRLRVERAIAAEGSFAVDVLAGCFVARL